MAAHFHCIYIKTICLQNGRFHKRAQLINRNQSIANQKKNILCEASFLHLTVRANR